MVLCWLTFLKLRLVLLLRVKLCLLKRHVQILTLGTCNYDSWKQDLFSYSQIEMKSHWIREGPKSKCTYKKTMWQQKQSLEWCTCSQECKEFLVYWRSLREAMKAPPCCLWFWQKTLNLRLQVFNSELWENKLLL
jgi:hypothetical protein